MSNTELSGKEEHTLEIKLSPWQWNLKKSASQGSIFIMSSIEGEYPALALWRYLSKIQRIKPKVLKYYF